MKRLVDEHPVFAPLPEDIKNALVEIPADDLVPLANRRTRKAWKKHGVLVHAYSGEAEGYTLRRAFHEVGGDRRLLHELDLQHGKPETDMSPSGKAYPLLLRLALNGMCKAWIAGPPCRTRSVLRHFAIPGQDMPRPLRAWHGEEHGLHDLKPYEKEQVFTDDVLMMRFLLLFVISEEVRKAAGEEDPTALFLEQPADQANMPEVVTLWRTSTWKRLAQLYNLETQTFNQSEFAAQPTKPTTTGGNLKIEVPLPGRRGIPRSTEGKTKQELCEESRALARWPPLMMRAIATALQLGPMKGKIKLRALSWKEHVAAGHTPFRKDCLVCQQASAKDQHHQRSKDPPRAGVLSLDMSGPFHLAPDLHGKQAKYMLIGAFTWLAPGQGGDDFEDTTIPEVPEGAPEIEDQEAQDEEGDQEIADADDVWGELAEERRKKAEERKEVEKGDHQEVSKETEEGEEALEERREPKIEVTKLCVPLPSKSQQDVLRAIIDLYLRLRSDGYVVTQIHTDRGGEFTQDALDKWCTSRTILHTYTAGDQPASNGRAEVTVQWVKAEIRRILHAAQAPFSRWPLAARNLNERLRLQQIGKAVTLPNFLTPVLVRKRFWRTRELLPTQEKVLYLGPSWVHHGHWVEREDGSFSLTRMVMHSLVEPPKDDDWIGLEDELAPTEVRRRIRGKVSLNHFAVNVEDSNLEGKDKDEEMKEEEEREEDIKKVRRVVEQEMRYAAEDDPIGSSTTLDAITKLKEMTCNTKVEEVLQTRVVAQHEVRKNLQDWIPSIKDELTALFEVKKALKTIDPAEVRRLVSQDLAEILPSKMVWTIKPSATSKSGKRKSRLVACGNFAERSDSDLFAGGATAVALRAAVAIASQNGWDGLVCDIRTAFLNATSGQERVGDDEAPLPKKAIIKPPPLLVAAGLAGPDEHWEVLMALYGYKESPKLWADYRDTELTHLKAEINDDTWLTLDQMITEPNMWRVIKHQVSGSSTVEQFCGILLVYVDDLLLLGEDSIMQYVIKAIQTKWETSIPEVIDETSGVRFLGTEIYRQGRKWWMTQRNYIHDLLARNLGPEEWLQRKIPMISEPETREEPPNRDLATIREAQRVVGELVWVATRTRPDLAFTITKLASLITKDPQQVLDLTKHVWCYLAATADHGLQFCNAPDEKQLNIYTDASFGTETSMGCHLVMWGTAMLLWKSGKQAVVTASTAEAELVEVLEGALAGDAVRVVMEEALDTTARAISYTDNTAALSIVTSENGSWRTRHLRKRAHILRSKVNQGEWLLRHMAGSEIPADLGTKVLAFEKFKFLKAAMGIFLGDEKKDDGSEKKKRKDENGGKVEVAEKALKAIILFAKLAQAKAEKENMIQLWNELIPIQSFAEPASGWPFFIIIFMVFSFGVMFGAVLAWFMIYPYFNRVTLVHSDIIPRPTFLMHALPRKERSQRTSTAPRPRNGQPLEPPSMSAGAAGGRSSDAAVASYSPSAGSIAADGHSSSAAAADGHSSSAAAADGRFSDAAAGRSSGASAADGRAAAGHSSSAGATVRCGRR